MFGIGRGNAKRTCIRGRLGSGVGLRDGFSNRESVAFAYGARLTRAVAVALEPGVCVGFRRSGRFCKGFGGGGGGTLELGAWLARLVAEVADGLCISGRSSGRGRFDRSDSDKGCIDHGGELHLECCIVEEVETLCKGLE